jgi:hypothetical protein
MARKGKVGIQYFSHDVDMLQDTKVKIIKAKHGLIGYAVYLRLLEDIYRSKGYYIHLDEDYNILFCDDNNLALNVYILILNDCINKELFDKKLYEKYDILTSKRIQFNYCSATERRKEVSFIEEFLLINVKEQYNSENINVDILPLNDDIGTQSKVKGKETERESKPNEIEMKKKVNNFFEECWAMYPVKRGKGSVSATTKTKLYKLGDEFKTCITRYTAEKANDNKYIQNGSTFFNNGYIDYTNGNFSEIEEIESEHF